MKIYIKAATRNILDEDPDVQLEIAGDYGTSTDVLEELSHSDNLAIVQEVMMNPNVDTATLDTCISALSNPDAESTPLYTTSQDRFLDKLASKEHLADSTFNLLADYSIKHPHSYIAIRLANNPKTPTSALFKLLDYDTHAHAVMDPIIKHPNATLAVVRELLIRDNGYCGYYDDVSKEFELPIEFIREFAHSSSEYYRRQVANDPQTPSDILYELTQEDNTWISGDAMKNPNLSEDAIWEIFNNSHDSDLACNSNCPSEILEYFANKWLASEDVYALQRIARHPNTPIDVLYRIFDSGLKGAYDSLASNPNIPTDISAKLAVYDMGWKDSTIDLRMHIARNPNTDPNVLASLVKSTWEVRQALAKNPNTPLPTLTKLSKDKSYQVKEVLTKNPNISQEIYDRLLADPSVPNWFLEKNPKFGKGN